MGDLCCSPPHICNLQVWAETHLQILEKFSESSTFEVVALSPQVNDSCLYCQIFFSAHSEVGFFIIKLGKIQAHQSKNGSVLSDKRKKRQENEYEKILSLG